MAFFKLFYYLYYAPRGFYLHGQLPQVSTLADEELSLRVYRGTVIFMTYYNAFDYFRLALFLAGILFFHVKLKRVARRQRQRVEAGLAVEPIQLTGTENNF